MCLFERAWSLRGFTAFLMDLVDDLDWAAELLDRISPTSRFGQRAENRFVGVNCGILDQYSSALGRAGSALLLDCRASDQPGRVRSHPASGS